MEVGGAAWSAPDRLCLKKGSCSVSSSSRATMFVMSKAVIDWPSTLSRLSLSLAKRLVSSPAPVFRWRRSITLDRLGREPAPRRVGELSSCSRSEGFGGLNRVLGVAVMLRGRVIFLPPLAVKVGSAFLESEPDGAKTGALISGCAWLVDLGGAFLLAFQKFSKRLLKGSSGAVRFL